MYLALEAAWAKYARAMEDLQALHKDTRRFLNAKPYGVGVKFEPKSGWYVAHTRIAQEPPPALSVLVGSIAHQCYSALNHVTWELVARKIGKNIAEQPEIRRHISFPISEKPRDFRSLHTVRKVSKKAQAVLNDLQPYSGPHPPRNPKAHPLFVIKDLADTDKHRLLAVSYGSVYLSDVWTGAAFGWNEVARGVTLERILPPKRTVQGGRSRMLKSGTELVRLRFDVGNADANVRVDRQPSAEIAFSSPSWSNLKVIDIAAFVAVTNRCISELAKLFPRQSWPPAGAEDRLNLSVYTGMGHV